MPDHFSCPVHAVILAGGLGRRMGGVDKGLVPLKGRPLIAHVIEAIAPQAGPLTINTANPDYARFALPLLHDAVPGHAGPLAGLLAALEDPRADLVLTVPCDTPRLPHDLVERLLKALVTDGAEACCVHDGERLHPVIALWRPLLAARLRRYLEGGGRRAQGWLASLEYATADFSDRPEAFLNVNDPEALRRIDGE